MQDFIVPSLQRGSFGELLRWDPHEAGVFMLRWVHKARTEWTERDAAVFLAWDDMKGRPQARTPADFVNAKQRLRAALRNTKTVQEVKNLRKGYRLYRIVDFQAKNPQAGESKKNSFRWERLNAAGCGNKLKGRLKQCQHDDSSGVKTENEGLPEPPVKRALKETKISSAKSNCRKDNSKVKAAINDELAETGKKQDLVEARMKATAMKGEKSFEMNEFLNVTFASQLDCQSKTSKIKAEVKDKLAEIEKQREVVRAREKGTGIKKENYHETWNSTFSSHNLRKKKRVVYAEESDISEDSDYYEESSQIKCQNHENVLREDSGVNNVNLPNPEQGNEQETIRSVEEDEDHLMIKVLELENILEASAVDSPDLGNQLKNSISDGCNKNKGFQTKREKCSQKKKKPSSKMSKKMAWKSKIHDFGNPDNTKKKPQDETDLKIIQDFADMQIAGQRNDQWWNVHAWNPKEEPLPHFFDPEYSLMDILEFGIRLCSENVWILKS